MRVIAGIAKGVRLARVPRGVRPVSDMAREGLFSSLAEHVAGARVLDLFAGTGALGIEALSRGAEHAVFVERNRSALATIAENLTRTRLSDRAEIVPADAAVFVEGHGGGRAPFGLALLDPPYDAPTGQVEAALAELARARLLAPGWAVVLTRRSGSSMPVIPVHWLATRRLEYGDTLVLIFREA
ncbi:MAG TPA: 16S rRNA (guanine(966)-N(2))-methyltransferase RsmD [Actinomycetota bacterium]|jgi:16S rRNA (guanine966-N2)-methyltransferase|nr:16S rRNA (guanine(966)-N(2))-methyltransferase RsmD [Actinomycetota bacterium]